MRFAGYAALFGIADAARDTIRRGAFARTLAERERPIPLFWQHRPEQRIGWIERAGEDARGLRVIAMVDNPNGRAAAALRTGSVTGLSFGYRSRLAHQAPTGRVLEDVELYEVSLVSHPLQHGARVHFLSPSNTPAKGRMPMDIVATPAAAPNADPLEASFDIVARQDACDSAIASLRSDVDEVKSRLDRVSRAAQRPALASETSAEVKSFVGSYLRTGRTAELKSLTSGVPSDGGYAVPREIDAAIARELTAISPIRAIAQVVQTGSSGYRKLVSTGGTASGWVSETAARPETDTPQFAEIAPPSGELYANPAASQAMLDDASFDLEAWLASEIAMEFARAEGAAFVSGSGFAQPEGFLNAPATTAADGARPFGTLQYVGTGDAAGFGNAPEARLIDLVHTLKAGHRQGASWVMNSATLAEVRKLKTADGAFLWQPGLVEGQPDRLLGYPVVEAEDMPDVAAGAFPIAFGNFKAGYLIAERSATSILRDPFTHKPFVHFYATKRVGGQVLDSAAIKLLRIEA